MPKKKTFEEPSEKVTCVLPTRLLNRADNIKPRKMRISGILAEGLELWIAKREAEFSDPYVSAVEDVDEALRSGKFKQAEVEDAKKTAVKGGIPKGKVQPRRGKASGAL